MNSDDIIISTLETRCHYCGRLAPEIHYDEISVCRECLVKMGGDDWTLFRMPDGNLIMHQSNSNEDLSNWVALERGPFDYIYNLMLEASGEYDR